MSHHDSASHHHSTTESVGLGRQSMLTLIVPAGSQKRSASPNELVGEPIGFGQLVHATE